MKVGIVSVFPPFRGGIAQFNVQLVSALRADAHELLAVNFSRQYPSWLFPGKSQYSAEQASEVYPAMLDSMNPLTWKKVARHFIDNEVDLVVIPYWTAYLAPALLGVMRHLKDVKIYGLLHNAIPHDAGRWQKAMSSRFIRRCERVICLSDSVAQDVKKLLPSYPDAQITKLFHPVYNDFGNAEERTRARKKLDFRADEKVLLYFGLIRPYKGLDTLLEAFNQLPEDYRLIVAGEPYMSMEELHRIPSADGKKRIHWDLRFIPTEDIQCYFGAADLVVLPYKSATQSGVTAAAMHFGLPVIASKVGGLADYIEPGISGDLFSPFRADALASTIEAWFAAKGQTDDEMRRRVREKAKDFSWESFAQGFFS